MVKQTEACDKETAAIPTEASGAVVTDVKQVDVRSSSGAISKTGDVAVACAPLPGEMMSVFYGRLKQMLQGPHDLFKRCDSMAEDGLYLHKRPVRGAGPANPLGAAGTVYYHCVLYIKHGETLHSLDLAPSSGGDITTSLFESIPPRGVHASSVAVPSEDLQLPFLWLGRDHLGLEHELVQQAIKFAESRHYQPLTNNCIHFAEFMARLLTNGRAAGAVHVFDVLCGSAPSQEVPMLMMLQMMMQASWAMVCDCTRLMQEFNTMVQQQLPAA